MHLPMHDCSRFVVRGMPCPFRELAKPEAEDTPPDEEFFRDIIPIGERNKEARTRALNNLSTIAVAKGEVKEALERMAAIQQTGGLPSIPNMEPFMDFPLQGRGHPEIIAVLTAIAIAAGLRAGRSSTFRSGFRAVQASEMRVAQGLSKHFGTSPLRGRGGMLRNDARALRELLGFQRRKFAGPEAGGFNPHGTNVFI